MKELEFYSIKMRGGRNLAWESERVEIRLSSRCRIVRGRVGGIFFFLGGGGVHTTLRSRIRKFCVLTPQLVCEKGSVYVCVCEFFNEGKWSSES